MPSLSVPHHVCICWLFGFVLIFVNKKEQKMAETLAEEKPKEKSKASRRKDKKDKTNQIVKVPSRLS